MPYNIRPYIPFDIVRLRVTPEEGLPAIQGHRPRGSRRPHTDLEVAKVRHLIEQTALTYSAIAAKTGVGRASICRWTAMAAGSARSTRRAPPIACRPPAPASA